MTIDSIIKKYGTHELDVSCCIDNGEVSEILAYCHQHDVHNQFIVNHYLKITGKFTVLNAEVDDGSDVYIHMAYVEKASEDIYELSGVGSYPKFFAEGEFYVEGLTEAEYDNLLK